MSESIMGRALSSGKAQLTVVDPRQHSSNKHRKVDDTPYGGGAGMVLACQPILAAFRSLLPLPAATTVVMTTPAGRPFTNQVAKRWAQQEALVFLCGHYEGFDARIKPLLEQEGAVVEEVSLGDYVLTGGELPALAMMDATLRFVGGVVKESASVSADSFENGLLDYPHYTKPALCEGLGVPEVLLSGNHAAIAAWRNEQALLATQTQRPDLL